MSAKMNRRAKRLQRRNLSRRLLNQMLDDLGGRLSRQVEVAEAIERTIAPNGQHTVLEHQIRTAFGVMLEGHLRGLKDAAGLAAMLCKREARA